MIGSSLMTMGKGVAFSKYGTEAEKIIAPLLFDDKIQVLSSFDMNKIASLTYGDKCCVEIFDMLGNTLAHPSEHTVVTLQKALALVQHTVVYGSDDAVDGATGIAHVVRGLLCYNTVRDVVGTTTGLVHMVKGGAVDQGGPVRDAAAELHKLLSCRPTIYARRTQHADPGSLVPIGRTDEVAYQSAEHAALQEKMGAVAKASSSMKPKSSGAVFGAGASTVIGATHSIEEMLERAAKERTSYCDDPSDPRYIRRREQIEREAKALRDAEEDERRRMEQMEEDRRRRQAENADLLCLDLPPSSSSDCNISKPTVYDAFGDQFPLSTDTASLETNSSNALGTKTTAQQPNIVEPQISSKDSKPAQTTGDFLSAAFDSLEFGGGTNQGSTTLGNGGFSLPSYNPFDNITPATPETGTDTNTAMPSTTNIAPSKELNDTARSRMNAMGASVSNANVISSLDNLPSVTVLIPTTAASSSHQATVPPPADQPPPLPSDAPSSAAGPPPPPDLPPPPPPTNADVHFQNNSSSTAGGYTNPFQDGGSYPLTSVSTMGNNYQTDNTNTNTNVNIDLNSFSNTNPQSQPIMGGSLNAYTPDIALTSSLNQGIEKDASSVNYSNTYSNSNSVHSGEVSAYNINSDTTNNNANNSPYNFVAMPPQNLNMNMNFPYSSGAQSSSTMYNGMQQQPQQQHQTMGMSNTHNSQQMNMPNMHMMQASMNSMMGQNNYGNSNSSANFMYSNNISNNGMQQPTFQSTNFQQQGIPNSSNFNMPIGNMQQMMNSFTQMSMNNHMQANNNSNMQMNPEMMQQMMNMMMNMMQNQNQNKQG